MVRSLATPEPFNLGDGARRRGAPAVETEPADPEHARAEEREEQVPGDHARVLARAEHVAGHQRLRTGLNYSFGRNE